MSAPLHEAAEAAAPHVETARGVELTEVESTFEGNADVRGALGLSDEVRNGFESIRATLEAA